MSVCSAVFKTGSSSQVSQWKSSASSAASRAGCKVNFKERPTGGGTELGVQFCGNSESDVQRAISYLKGGALPAAAATAAVSFV